ncbi:predicted protein [Nematostella vectensis]|uniref:Nudix hydrolase domain-containing protein n=1 Tax=Nematostella vectensis TaxID=45351 RepID=A7RHD4_NEMVE|nr:predicted protein [Nematostella vectensis]|eukprot:XP_001641389.1 predicted protein [Nematostella vectensis]
MADDSAKNLPPLAECKARIFQYKESEFNKGKSTRTVYPRNFSIAAVLILLVFKNNKFYLRLTRRSENLRSHKGQVVFPGGKNDDSDQDIVETALREAQEEIGLPKESVEIITVLSPSWIRRNKVYPVLGFLKHGFHVKMNKFEVDAVFDAPLEFFLSKEHHFPSSFDTGMGPFNYHAFSYQAMSSDVLSGSETSFIIFGFTAGFCVTIAIIVMNRLPPFQLHDIPKDYNLQAYMNWLSKASEYCTSKL